MKNFRLLLILGLVGLLTQGCGQFNPIEGTEGGSPFAPEGTEGSISKVNAAIQTAPITSVSQGLYTSMCMTTIELIKADGSVQSFEINEFRFVGDNWDVFAEFDIEEGFYRELVVNTADSCDAEGLADGSSPWQPSVRMWFNEYHIIGSSSTARALDYHEPARLRFMLNTEITQTWRYITIDTYRLEDAWEGVDSYEAMGHVVQSGFLF